MEIELKSRKIGDGHPTFFIAEAGVNHNGSIENCIRLIDIAVEAGADAVKFQTFKTENIITRDAPKSTYHVETTGSSDGQSWFDLLKTQEMTREMHVQAMQHCHERGIMFMSTPYDVESAMMLCELGVQMFKIASTDLNNIPFLEQMANFKIPLILSTAMSTMDEVEESVAAIRNTGLNDFAVLQCTGNYPSMQENSNLAVMATYREKLGCVVGFSDHSLAHINPIASVAAGAAIYEMHFTISKDMPGPDHRMSADPEELANAVRLLRLTWNSMGSGEKGLLEEEVENRAKLRKSIVAARDIRKGELFDESSVAIKRPGTGLAPKLLPEIATKSALIDIKKDTPITAEMLS